MPAPASAPLCASHKAGAAPPAGAQPPALSSSSERSVEEGDEGGGYRHSPTNTPVSPAPGRSRTLPGARSRSGLPPAVVTCSPPLAHRATGGGRLRAAASPLARRCLRGESLAVRGITLPPRAHDRWVRTAHGRRARPSVRLQLGRACARQMPSERGGGETERIARSLPSSPATPRRRGARQPPCRRRARHFKQWPPPLGHGTVTSFKCGHGKCYKSVFEPISGSSDYQGYYAAFIGLFCRFAVQRHHVTLTR